MPGAAEVLGLELLDRVDGGVDVLDGDGVGGRAERGGDRGLVAGPDGQQRGDRAEQAGDRRRWRPAARRRRPCG